MGAREKGGAGGCCAGSLRRDPSKACFFLGPKALYAPGKKAPGAQKGGKRGKKKKRGVPQSTGSSPLWVFSPQPPKQGGGC